MNLSFMELVPVICLGMSFLLPIFVLKTNKAIKLKKVLYKLFWVNEFPNELKISTFISKMFLYFYCFISMVLFFNFAMSFDVGELVPFMAFSIVFPLMYRVITVVRKALFK